MRLRNVLRRVLGSRVAQPTTGERSKEHDQRALGLGDRWHYHTQRDRAGEIIWQGQYDLYPLWHHFAIPDDLDGQSVIDIGTATGFFAFECEKRGASRVVGTELPDVKNWDTRADLSYQGPNIPQANHKDFSEAARILDSRVEIHFGNICDALPQLGEFDWVIFGSMMTHVSNPITALQNVRALTRGRAIIISSYAEEEGKHLHWIRSERPFDWWCPTKSLVPSMLLAAGFSRVEETGDFLLRHHNGQEQQQACWHAFP